MSKNYWTRYGTFEDEINSFGMIEDHKNIKTPNKRVGPYNDLYAAKKKKTWQEKKARLDALTDSNEPEDGIVSRYRNRSAAQKSTMMDDKLEENFNNGANEIRAKNKKDDEYNSSLSKYYENIKTPIPFIESVAKFITSLHPITWDDMKVELENEYEDEIEKMMRSVTYQTLLESNIILNKKDIIEARKNENDGTDDKEHSLIRLNNCGVYEPKFIYHQSFFLDGPKFTQKHDKREHLLHIVTYLESGNDDIILLFYGHYPLKVETQTLFFIDHIMMKMS